MTASAAAVQIPPPPIVVPPLSVGIITLTKQSKPLNTSALTPQELVLITHLIPSVKFLYNAVLQTGSQVELAERLLRIIRNNDSPGAIDPVYDEGDLYKYDKLLGAWQPIEYSELWKIVALFDRAKVKVGTGDKLKRFRVDANTIRGVIAILEKNCTSKGFFKNAPPGLAFRDGFVTVSPTGIVVTPHSPANRARFAYAFPYDPTATCPRFVQMMCEHFDGDVDGLDKIQCELEFFGACLFGVATKFQKCLALPSGGGSGRSTLLNVIEAAFPINSVSHISANDLKRPERRARLPGMLLNFSAEVPSDAFLEAEEFKKCVTGDRMDAEEKYKASYEFVPIAGHVFPTQVAVTAEITEAFFSRFIIIRYNHDFRKSLSRVLELDKIIIRNEIPGIVVMLLEGAARLMMNNCYHLPESHTEETERWKTQADTVRAFLDDRYTAAKAEAPHIQGRDITGRLLKGVDSKDVKEHDWTSAADLYTDYRQWCLSNGRKPVSVQVFSHRIELVGYQKARNRFGFYYPLYNIDKARADARSRLAAGEKDVPEVEGAVTIVDKRRRELN